MAALPAADTQGIIRVTAALRISNGEVELLEVNDTPVGSKTDDDAPMPEPPPMDGAPTGLY